MASQQYSVSGNRDLRRKNYVNDINARLSKLPALLENKQKATEFEAENKYRADDLALRKDQAASDAKYRTEQLDLERISQANTEADRARQITLANRTYDFNKNQAKVGMGLEALKFGTTIGMGGFGGGKTVGGMVDSATNLVGGAGSTPVLHDYADPKTYQVGNTTTQGGLAPVSFTGKATNFVKGLDVGNTIGSGLAGWGASQMFGGGKKNKLKSALIGAGAGTLTGMLGGGSNWNSAIGGLGAGAIGGLFS